MRQSMGLQRVGHEGVTELNSKTAIRYKEVVSEGAADFRSVDGEFCSVLLRLRSWQHFRRSLEAWNQGQGKRGARMCRHSGIMCLQVMVTDTGIDEIIKGMDGEETEGGGEPRGEGKRQLQPVC